jgi:hypothetical protein
MKNKKEVTNRTANELLNLILELEKKRGNDFGYALGSGILIGIMDWARESSDITTLQREINYQYNRVKKELDTFEPLTAVTDYPTD